MLIDDLPALSFDVIRYQNRVAGYYRWRADGTLDESPYVMNAPKTLRDVLTELQSPEFVPAERYVALAPALRANYSSFDVNSLAHGMTTFDILVEHLPHHALVLVNAPLSSESTCDSVASPDGRARLRTRYESYASDIRDLIAKHNVHYLNYSGGIDVPAMKRNWNEAHCSGNVPSDEEFRSYLDAISPFYEAMFATKNVIATQAANYDQFSAEDAPFDQAGPPYSGRVRVGAIASVASGLDERGVAASYDFEKMRPSLGGADVYINSGIEDRRGKELGPMPSLRADVFGTTVFPALTGTSTSWAAPVALAHLITLRESRHASELFDDALIRKLTEELTPLECDGLPDRRCVFQDPLLHGQVEDLRLGYRPRVFTPLE
ncbi:hypothetical protein EON82_18685 [bacterium]|nr:MAG: hypothetical protein EON82_18685 [bacterium]